MTKIIFFKLGNVFSAKNIMFVHKAKNFVNIILMLLWTCALHAKIEKHLIYWIFTLYSCIMKLENILSTSCFGNTMEMQAIMLK